MPYVILYDGDTSQPDLDESGHVVQYIRHSSAHRDACLLDLTRGLPIHTVHELTPANRQCLVDSDHTRII